MANAAETPARDPKLDPLGSPAPPVTTVSEHDAVEETRTPSVGLGLAFFFLLCTALAVCTAALLLTLRVGVRLPQTRIARDAASLSCLVYCSGPVLEAVQSARLWLDGKTFVDLPMK